ncbi:MAG: hypothetical protein AB7P03_15540 [Kofleriaceae bacterium]
MSGTVLAQDAPAEGEPDPSTATDPATDPAATDPAATDPNAMPAEEAPAPSGRWPREVINRPLTQPKGMATVGVDVKTYTASFFDPAILKLGAGYGITDDFEISYVSYQFGTDEAGKGLIDAGIGYKILRGAAGGKLEMIARASTGYNMFIEEMNPLLVGAHVQYNVTPKVALITPGGQLSFALAGDPKPIFFQLPVAVGLQATPELYVQVDTTLASIKISNSENAFFGADVTPLALTAFYNVMPALDVFGQFGAENLTPPEGGPSASDTMFINVGARYYIGDL